MKPIRKLEDLSPAARTAFESAYVSGWWKYPALRDLLTQLAQIRLLLLGASERARRRQNLLVVLAAASVYAGFPMSDWAWTGLPVSLGLAIYFFVYQNFFFVSTAVGIYAWLTPAHWAWIGIPVSIVLAIYFFVFVREDFFFVLAALSVYAGLTMTNWAWIGIPVSLVLAIYFFVHRQGTYGTLPKGEFQVLIPILRDLRRDFRHVGIKMDLTGPRRVGDPTKEVRPPWDEVRQTFYAIDWCTMRLPLVDGSIAVLGFRTQLRETYKQRYGTSKGLSRKGGRGEKTKMGKSKTAWRKVCRVTATLIPALDCEWNQEGLQRPGADREQVRILVRKGVRVGRIVRSWKFKSMDGVPSDKPPAREIVGMLLRLRAAMKSSPNKPAEDAAS